MTAELIYETKELEIYTFILAPKLYLEEVPVAELFTVAAEGTSWSVQDVNF